MPGGDAWREITCYRQDREGGTLVALESPRTLEDQVRERLLDGLHVGLLDQPVVESMSDGVSGLSGSHARY